MVKCKWGVFDVTKLFPFLREHAQLVVSGVETRIPEVLTLVVLDFGEETAPIHVEIVLLNPGLPVLPLSVTGQALFVGFDTCLFLLLCEPIGSDFAPHLDLAQSLSGFFSQVVFHLLDVLRVFVLLLDWLIRFLDLLRGQVDQEFAHNFGPDELVACLCSHRLVLQVVIIESVRDGQVLVVDFVGV